MSKNSDSWIIVALDIGSYLTIRQGTREVDIAPENGKYVITIRHKNGTLELTHMDTIQLCNYLDIDTKRWYIVEDLLLKGKEL